MGSPTRSGFGQNPTPYSHRSNSYIQSPVEDAPSGAAAQSRKGQMVLPINSPVSLPESDKPKIYVSRDNEEERSRKSDATDCTVTKEHKDSKFMSGLPSSASQNEQLAANRDQRLTPRTRYDGGMEVLSDDDSPSPMSYSDNELV